MKNALYFTELVGKNVSILSPFKFVFTKCIRVMIIPPVCMKKKYNTIFEIVCCILSRHAGLQIMCSGVWSICRHIACRFRTIRSSMVTLQISINSCSFSIDIPYTSRMVYCDLKGSFYITVKLHCCLRH